MTQERGKKIYNIPPGVDFLEVLARGIAEECGSNPKEIAKAAVLLPTRRAVRLLKSSFDRLAGEKPGFLPKIQAIGDVDEEYLRIAAFDVVPEIMEIPPAISPLKRQIMLARLISSKDYGRKMHQNMELAQMLGTLMDQVYTEGLDLKKLPELVDLEQFSEHWKITVSFLEILSENWVKILKENNVIDEADKRRRLIEMLSKYWEEIKPEYPIIAAGSTGSIPATAELLRVVSSLPAGEVILPGLDMQMDEESWSSVDETHPQFTMKCLLEKIGAKRCNVEIYPYTTDGYDDAREEFINEVMQPSRVCNMWSECKNGAKKYSDTIRHVNMYDLNNQQEEALVIATILREVLENEGKRAAVITPDRKLAKRIRIACRRWGIDIDDSGGKSLADSETGIFMLLCAETALDSIRPVSLLSVLKHSLCRVRHSDMYGCVKFLEKKIFRKGYTGEGFEPIYDRLRQIGENVYSDQAGRVEKLLDSLENAIAPMLEVMGREKFAIEVFIDRHITMIEMLGIKNAADDEETLAAIWDSPDGKKCRIFLEEMREYASMMPKIDGEEYVALLKTVMKQIVVRPEKMLHPRVAILGQMEARMYSTDVTILAGLNEGTWPGNAMNDPWMSRPMKKRFGLPSPEKSIGLAAHDFVQAFCAKEVFLTRSRKVDGTPTIPSRWLRKIDAVLNATAMGETAIRSNRHVLYAAHLGKSNKVEPCKRPEPRPPVAARPVSLSVTQIEKLLFDPYSIFARYILGLRPLDMLEKLFDAADKGSMIHKIMERFVNAEEKTLSKDAKERLIRIIIEEMEKAVPCLPVSAFLMPRVMKIAEWIIEKEREYRKLFFPVATEVRGEVEFSVKGEQHVFTLTGIADRIDISHDGETAAIVDYKSGTGEGFSVSGIGNGRFPQLPLEAVMLQKGGFADIADKRRIKKVGKLSYWVLSGGQDGGKIVELVSGEKVCIDEILDEAEENFIRLVDVFYDERTPYYSIPNPDNVPRFNNYEHLARVKEWSSGGEEKDS